MDAMQSAECEGRLTRLFHILVMWSIFYDKNEKKALRAQQLAVCLWAQRVEIVV